MRPHGLTIPALILFLGMAALSAQNADPLYESYFASETASLPNAGSRLFNTANLANFQLSGGIGSKSEKISVEGLPFSIAFRLTVARP
jgi:hypothetical protein